MIILGIIAGISLISSGTLLIAVGNRLARYLTSQPMHREGDALFMYIIGAGYSLVILGLISTSIFLAIKLL